ncbi:putative ribokinase [Sporobolomyces koalae]|uniref:putative ribokinase n=1 Tax=Sporobolomyces koalae TaxID=500713 RepID=UPI0031703BB8
MSPEASQHGKLLVRGSINIDEFFVLDHIVRVGETISSTGYSRRAGGKGANQAVSAAKAGAVVELAATIGNDGDWLKDTLSSFGVSQTLLSVDETVPTGRAIIQLSSATADNSIVLLPGANFTSKPSPLSALSREQLGATFTHLLLQNEIPLESTKQALRDARAAGLTTILNPSPMLTREQLETFEWDNLDWLLINEGEGQDLAAVLSPTGSTTAAISQPEEILRILRETKLSGLTGILMTRGADGVMAGLKGGDIVSVGAGKVEGGVVDTTGAGDCFTGFFATLLSTLSPQASIEPAKIKQILEIACQAGAMCVESHGAMESVPSLEQVRARLGEQWIPGQEWDILLQ